jgi:hypothetical protein
VQRSCTTRKVVVVDMALSASRLRKKVSRATSDLLLMLEAAHAITEMDGRQVGSQSIAVTLHEPRKLRPEKVAERGAHSRPLGRLNGLVNRRSSSPLRGMRRPRDVSSMRDEPTVSVKVG